MGFFSSLGGILGGVAGSIIAPGVGTVIGAGLGSSLGGGIDSNSAAKTQQGYYNSQMDFARQQMQFQQDYAKSVMQWRVEDAKKAGVHPMAALGMSNPSYSPVSLPSIPSSAGADSSFNPMEFGQSLNYAATKGKDKKQQADMLNLQVEGLILDNEYKRAQIDQLKVDTLASSIASDQALRSPGAPTVNATSPHNVTNNPNASGGYAGPSVPLLTLARSGNTLLDVINPDIADSVTESAYRNAIAAITPEYSVAQGYLKPPIEYLTPSEQARVKKGELELVRFPGGWSLEKTMRYRVSKIPKSDLDKKFFNWFDGFFK